MNSRNRESPVHVLLVEDDQNTARYVSEGLLPENIVVHTASDGHEGLRLAQQCRWDVILLDRMLPGMDGLSILTRLRGDGMATPIIFLTTMDSVPSRVGGLRQGADDYMVKPFAVRELAARIQVLLRRTRLTHHALLIRIADIELDLLARSVTRNGRKVLLQPQEMNLLEFFMRNPRTVLSRQTLLKYVWNMDFPVRTNIVETHLSRLREKLGRNAAPVIHTVKGRGYIMTPPEDAL